MNKKLCISIIIIFLFGVTVVCGQVHWREKIIKATSKVVQQEYEVIQKIEPIIVSPNYEMHTKNLPDVVRKKVEKAVFSKQLVHLVIVGDQASANNQDAWPIKLIEQIKETYGNGVWNITLREWKDEGTNDLLSNKRFEELIALKADVILFQPPLLTDNNRGGNKESLENLDHFLKLVTESLKDTTIIIQPPNPIYNATHYPKAVLELQMYAEQHKYIYLNHWQNWPNPSSEDILPYLQSEHGFPSTKGHELWAQYINHYFAGK